MIPLPRRRPSFRPRLQTLEDRATPATAAYAALSQTLTIVAADGDQVSVAALAGSPTGYIQVSETQAGETVFDSAAKSQAVRNLVVKFAGVDSGGFVLNSGVQLGGNLSISGAKATQIVDLLGTVGGYVRYTANILSAFDDIDVESSAVIGRNLSINLGAGSNTVRLKGGLIRGNLKIVGGVNDDSVDVTESGDVTVNGSAAIRLGDGTNRVKAIGLAKTLRVGANFSYVGGSGNDTFDMDGFGGALEAGANARFVFGSPLVFDSNLGDFEALRAGRNIVFAGGVGNDTVIVTGAMEAGRNVSLRLGNGDNSFDSNQEGMGTNNIVGGFTYLGGLDGDIVSLDAINIGKANVSLGESGGATQAFSTGTKNPAGVTVYGDMKVTGGADTDAVILRRTYIGNKLSVMTLSGNDIVTIDDTDVAAATTIDMGLGDDVLQAEMLGNDSGGALTDATTFGGRVIIKAGDGNDAVRLSDDSDATTLIKFGARATFQGGLGNDTLQNGAENVFMVTGNLNDFDILIGTAVT
jgi:hypothetical protein